MKITALFSAIAFAIGLAIGAGATGSHYRHKLAQLVAEQAKREAAIATAVMEAQQAHAQQITEALNDAQAKTTIAQRDAAAATIANSKLRKSLAAYRAKNAGATCTGQSEQDSDPVGVLADLFSGCSDRYSAVARYADEVKIAGSACEAAWPQ